MERITKSYGRLQSLWKKLMDRLDETQNSENQGNGKNESVLVPVPLLWYCMLGEN